MAEFKDTLPQVGRLEWIGLASAEGAPIEVVERADVELGTGLAGDYRAADGDGRQVTLIQAEHLDAMASILARENVDPALCRRNLVVAGINLKSLEQRRFRVGEVVFEGTGPCAPCGLMEEQLGPGGYNAMRGHGGIVARVVAAGTIAVGDDVRSE